ncbi:hypothetical protein PFISCL1PPCAC_7431, partial [Pristionchus fissidentatus]
LSRCIVAEHDKLPHCSNNMLQVDGEPGIIECDDTDGKYKSNGKILTETSTLSCNPDPENKNATVSKLEKDLARGKAKLREADESSSENNTNMIIVTGLFVIAIILAAGLFVWREMPRCKLEKAFKKLKNDKEAAKGGSLETKSKESKASQKLNEPKDPKDQSDPGAGSGANPAPAPAPPTDQPISQRTQEEMLKSIKDCIPRNDDPNHWQNKLVKGDESTGGKEHKKESTATARTPVTPMTDREAAEHERHIELGHAMHDSPAYRAWQRQQERQGAAANGTANGHNDVQNGNRALDANDGGMTTAGH